MQFIATGDEERSFEEFRRKVRDSEVLSASLEKLLSTIHFTGRVSVAVQNGRVLKSGYEEGYFRNEARRRNGRSQVTADRSQVCGGRIQVLGLRSWVFDMRREIRDRNSA